MINLWMNVCEIINLKQYLWVVMCHSFSFPFFSWCAQTLATRVHDRNDVVTITRNCPRCVWEDDLILNYLSKAWTRHHLQSSLSNLDSQWGDWSNSFPHPNDDFPTKDLNCQRCHGWWSKDNEWDERPEKCFSIFDAKAIIGIHDRDRFWVLIK